MEFEPPAAVPFDVGAGPSMPDAQIMENGKVDLSVYYSDERFQDEKKLFGKIWLNIAEEAEIPNPGDWVVREVAIHSASVIIARGKDGKVRAFHNICAHRGMKLVWDDHGKGGKFACPYHGWVYDAQGDLLRITDEECFKYVDKDDSGLTPIRCDIWEGFVFINLDADGTQTLAEFLGPLKDRVRNLPFKSYPYIAKVGAFIDANWKAAMEAQCEAYHVRSLHSRTVANVLSSKDNPFVHPIACEILGAHRMNSVPRNPDFAPSPQKPVQMFAFTNAAQMTVTDTSERGHPKETFGAHPDVNVKGENLWGNDQYILYPHFIFHVAMNGSWLHRFWPVAPDKTYWEAVYHFEKPQSLRGIFATEYSLSLNRDTLMEDNLALVQQQQVMKSGAKKLVQFGDQELMCKHAAAVAEAAVAQLHSCKSAAE